MIISVATDQGVAATITALLNYEPRRTPQLGPRVGTTTSWLSSPMGPHALCERNPKPGYHELVPRPTGGRILALPVGRKLVGTLFSSQQPHSANGQSLREDNDNNTIRSVSAATYRESTR